VTLGAEIARGGEGIVYDIAGRSGSVAKIYLAPQDRAKADKIAAMVAMATDRLSALAAWPTATLHRPGGELAGFVMPKLTGHRPVFQVYGPKLRLRQFPRADWRFLVHTAGNVARAFGVVHGAGLVVGDVNQNSLFVGADATVRFIDTDSMQVSRGGRIWRCEVGVSTHQPPEMQGLASYRDVTRTQNHDAFGLAVVIFQLLCMGRHPFAGRYSGRGEPPGIDEAIAESRYAYSADTGRTQMSPPPGSLPMSALPADLRAMFEAAFAPSRPDSATVRASRPGADRWVTALGSLGTSLKKCAVNAAHWYAPVAGSCPWCEIEARSGVALFPAVFVAGQHGGGIVLLWQEIQAVPDPGPLPPLQRPPTGSAEPSPRALAARRRLRNGGLLAAGALIAGVALVLAVIPAGSRALSLIAVLALAAGFWWVQRRPELAEARAILKDAHESWAKLEANWMPGPAKRFAATRQALHDLKREHDAMPERRSREMHALASGRQSEQLRSHLEGFEIATAKVPGIGRAKIAALLSFGIETAADLEASRIEAVPGFGPKTAAALLAFRRSCEAAFHFDDARTVAPAQVHAMDGMLEQRRAKLEADLAAGLAQLRAMSVGERRHREALEMAAEGLRPAYAQALADARALGVR
jgi:DNA-binding helix-hairpin-helix protein with protein kinase domain